MNNETTVQYRFYSNYLLIINSLATDTNLINLFSVMLLRLKKIVFKELFYNLKINTKLK